MSIAGKYIGTGEQGFKEYLAKEGVPTDRQPKDGKNEYEFKVTGDKVIVSHLMGDRPPKTTEYILGQQIEEKFGDRVIKSTATLAGNTLTIVSVGSDGKERSRIYNFSESGLEVTHKSSNGEGKLIYKRV